MPETAVVHIVDDDPSLRQALDSLFRSMQLGTRSFSCTQDFLAASHPDLPSCLVLDIRLPGMSGLDFQQSLSSSGVHLPVVLMTGHADIPMTVRGMKAGAVDFLTKPFRDQDMLDAVSSAIEKDRQRRTADGELAALRKNYHALSPREREVMKMVVAGRLNKQVASDLHLAEVTVKIHRGAVMRKMGARSVADLVRMSESLKLPRALVGR